MGDRDFRKQCLQCKRMIPQLHVCISQSCDEKFMTLICEQCHKDIHDHQKIHEKKDNVKQISLDEFLLQIEGMIDRQNQIEKEGKSEDILNLVSQINDSVNTIDDIVSRLQGVKTNLLTVKEQVSNPSAQAKTIHQNLQIQSSSSYQQIIQNLQQLKGFAQFENNTLVLKDLKQTNIVREVAQTQTRVNNILQILLQSSEQTQQQQQLTKDALKSQAIEKVNQQIKQINLNIAVNQNKEYQIVITDYQNKQIVQFFCKFLRDFTLIKIRKCCQIIIIIHQNNRRESQITKIFVSIKNKIFFFYKQKVN